jgi:excisionase family DNA binding protein
LRTQRGAPAPADGEDDDVNDTASMRGRLLTPGEVATLFRVDPKTVTRWAAAGRISSIRTPGGHRRFREAEVRALLDGTPLPAATTPPTIPAQTPPQDVAGSR